VGSDEERVLVRGSSGALEVAMSHRHIVSETGETCSQQRGNGHGSVLTARAPDRDGQVASAFPFEKRQQELKESLQQIHKIFVFGSLNM
jgi:hypothetical protein